MWHVAHRRRIWRKKIDTLRALVALGAIAIAGCDPHAVPAPRPSPTISPCQLLESEYPSGTISCETVPIVSGSPIPLPTPTPLSL